MQRFAWVVFLCLTVSCTAYAEGEHIRDFYQEPGLNPFKDDTGDKNFESIDPFSGNLKLSFTDITLPGNGGMDINVTRVYNNPQYQPTSKETSAIGYGWTMHQGRVVFTAAGELDPANQRSVDICSQIDGSTPTVNSILDNPSFELPDGSRMMFYRDSVSVNGDSQFISKENWKLVCTPEVPDGYEITAPNGTKYIANRFSDNAGGNIYSWYVTEIRDVHYDVTENDNSINISYIALYPTDNYQNYAIWRITDSSNREITFNYVNIGTPEARLESIVVDPNDPAYPARTWTYFHAPMNLQGNGYDMNVLTQVVRPDDSNWQFTYYKLEDIAPEDVDAFQFVGLLRQVYYPFATSGNICYQYSFINQVDGLAQNSGSMSLARKVLDLGVDCPLVNPVLISDLGMPDRVQPSWDYIYDRAIANEYDKTTISLPYDYGRIEYRYIGFASLIDESGSTPNNGINNNIWKIGLQKEKRIYDQRGLLEVTQSDWSSRLISNEFISLDISSGNEIFSGTDTSIYAPQIAEQRIIRTDPNNQYPDTLFDEANGYTYRTTYENYDAFGNPETITESGQNPPGIGAEIPLFATRTTHHTYQNLEGPWIIGLNESTSISNIDGQTFRDYYPNGDLRYESAYGVRTDHTYYPNGEVETTTDANGNITTFRNYKHGIPQEEEQPGGIPDGEVPPTNLTIIIRREVSEYGTITWEEDGRQNRTDYTYDALNRVDGIRLPLFSALPISVQWRYGTHNARTVTRGMYENTQRVDVRGRVIENTHTDNDTGEIISVAYDYDVFDRKTFESYPSNTLIQNPAPSLGTTYVYDQLNRIEKITHSDGSEIVYTYYPYNRVDITDENDHTTHYYYRAYGDPSKSSLIRIEAPVDESTTITTIIDRDEMGQVVSIRQGDETANNYKERSFTYYPTRFLHTETNPETGVTTYVYDNVGNMRSRQVGTSDPVLYTYDDRNRLDTIDYPETTLIPHQPDVKYVYYDNDKVNVIIDRRNNSSRDFNYDPNDNLLGEILTVGGATIGYFDVAYQYNNMDHVRSIRYPRRTTLILDPDNFGRTRSIDEYTGSILTPIIQNVDYYPTGQASSIEYANGVTTNFSLTDRKWLDVIDTNSPTIGQVTGFDYDYDLAGNPNHIRDLVNSAYTLSNIQYDWVNRLTHVDGNWGTGRINYDHRGNVLTKNIGDYQLTYNYDSITDRLDSTTGRFNHNFGYDGRGNIQSYGGKTFTYNSVSNLTRVTGPNLDKMLYYDGNGNLIKTYSAGVTRYMFYSDGGNILGEYNDAGLLRKEYIYLGGKLVGILDEAPAAPSTITVGTPDVNNNYTINWGTVLDTITHYEVIQADNPMCVGGTTITVPANQTYYDVTNQDQGTYYYCVRACNDDICGDFIYGNNQCAIIGDNSAPCIPNGITIPANDNDRTYDITWGAATGNVTAYELEQAATSDFTNASIVYTGPNLTHTITNQLDGTYYYRVRACNGAACSPYVKGGNPVVETGPLTLAIPLYSLSGKYIISWSPVQPTYPQFWYNLREYNAPGFNSAYRTGDYNTIESDEPPNSIVIGGKANGDYYYQVAVCYSYTTPGCTGSCLEVVRCDPYTDGLNPVHVGGPVAPKNININGPDASGNYIISWDNVILSEHIRLPYTNYRLKQSTDQQCQSGTETGVSALETSYTVTNPTNEEYYYCMRTCVDGICSAYSEAVQMPVVAPGIPAFIRAQASFIGELVSIVWNGTTGPVTHYELYEASAIKGFLPPTFTNYVLIDTRSVPSLSDTDASRYTLTKSNAPYYYYQYRVRACYHSICGDDLESNSVYVSPSSSGWGGFGFGR